MADHSIVSPLKKQRSTDHLEIALIELQYLAGEACLEAQNKCADAEFRAVAHFYRAACDALALCLQAREQADAKKMTLLSARSHAKKQIGYRAGAIIE